MAEMEQVKEALLVHTARLLESEERFGDNVGVIYKTKFFDFKLTVCKDIDDSIRDRTFRNTLTQLVNNRPELLLNVVLNEDSKSLHSSLCELELWLDSRSCEMHFVNQSVWYKKLRTRFFLYTGIWF